MQTKEILYELRTKHGLSQDALAEKVFVMRLALGDRRDGAEHRNAEAAFEAV